MKKLITLLFALSIMVLSGLIVHGDTIQINKEKLDLTEDMIITGDTILTEKSNLNGFTLTVEGNLIIEDEMNLNGGKLVVQGDLRLQKVSKNARELDYSQMTEADFGITKAVIKMDKPEDYILVEGNYYTSTGENTMRAGITEFKGDLINNSKSYNKSYFSSGTHKTLFSGDKDQKVHIVSSGSLINILQVNKESGTLVFETPLQILSIDEDTTIPVGGNGYIHLALSSKNQLNLNGHKLIIDGNLILSSGSINFNKGSLDVKKDFRIQGFVDSKNTTNYDQMKDSDFQFCSGTLSMDNQEDYLLVNGDFYPNGRGNTMRNGTVELKGNFMFTTNAYMDCYNAIGKHKTLFTGAGDQEVFFSRSGSQFAILGVEKKSGKMIFKSAIDFASVDKDTTIPVGGNGYMYLSLYTNKTLSLKGHKLTVDGTVFLARGDINVDGGSLIIKDDFRLEAIQDLSKKIQLNLKQLVERDFSTSSIYVQIIMKNPKDYILVHGDMIFRAHKEQIGLRNGIMELKGNIYQKDTMKSFLPADKHMVILSGEKAQTVSFKNPSYMDSKKKVTFYSNFNTLKLNNKDVYFKTNYKPSSGRSIHWYNKLIPFVPKVNLNGKIVDFQKYSPVVLNTVIYFEINEAEKVFGETKAKLKMEQLGKAKYIEASSFLKSVGATSNYDPKERTLFVKK